MSHLTSIETVCTFCRHPNDAEVWSAINVKTDPELKDILSGGELNMIECVSCKEIFYAEHFLLYHDPDFELMVFVYPHSYGSQKEKWELKTMADFAQTQAEAGPEQKLSYDPISLFGLNQLVFLVEDEEEMTIQSQIAELLAQENGFQVRRLKPSDARLHKLPLVLPYVDKAASSAREAVMDGLAALKALNDRLSVYKMFEERLSSDPSIDLSLGSL